MLKVPLRTAAPFCKLHPPRVTMTSVEDIHEGLCVALREHGLQDLGVPAVAQAIVREVCPNGLILVDILGFEEVRQAHVNAGCLQRQVVPAEGTREGEQQAWDEHNKPAWRRAVSRMPALLVTLVIELFVALIVTEYTDTFKKYTLLIAFQPVISALSGNVGLQTMATITRGLVIGIFNGRETLRGMRHEVKSGMVVAALLSTVVAAVAFAWYNPFSSGHSFLGTLAFGFAIFLGQFASSISASVTGSLAPLLFNKRGWDPAALGGPLETAFQDVIGSSVMLAASAAVLAQFGDHAESCPGGDVKRCASLCKEGPSYNEQCLQHCLDLALKGVC
ncbi:mgtE [Symbiodinium necroappetens]|uniref:MgtE protein n=1 Tax=Symbiodinium necroappetens TaxID=1628268 RepID=A0A812NZU2_9DINO|nr:mgtE [Symbiodinium necroappetens]